MTTNWRRGGAFSTTTGGKGGGVFGRIFLKRKKRGVCKKKSDSHSSIFTSFSRKRKKQPRASSPRGGKKEGKITQQIFQKKPGNPRKKVQHKVRDLLGAGYPMRKGTWEFSKTEGRVNRTKPFTGEKEEPIALSLQGKGICSGKVH